MPSSASIEGLCKIAKLLSGWWFNEALKIVVCDAQTPLVYGFDVREDEEVKFCGRDISPAKVAFGDE